MSRRRPKEPRKQLHAKPQSEHIRESVTFVALQVLSKLRLRHLLGKVDGQ